MVSLSIDKDGLPRKKFPKEERLSSQKLIDQLFTKGSSFYQFPFRLTYIFEEPSDKFPAILFSVPKKNFKKAVDRNRIKRQLREIYRRQKHAIFLEMENGTIPAAIAIIYTAKEKLSFAELEKKLILILLRLKETPVK